MKNTTSLTVGLLVILAILGAADALILENERLLAPGRQAESQEPERAMAGGTSSVPSTQGTAEKSGPDVLNFLAAKQMETADPAKERSLIEQIIPATITVRTKILMKNDDRVGLMAWTESPQVNIYFLALKEALHSTFSPQMHDLVDELQEQEGRPPRNLLTFIDSGINEERIVVVRVRNRLYEFHVAEGKDDVVFELIEALTQ